MPELPEVETVRCGIEKHLLGCKILRVEVRQRKLRYPVTRCLEKKLTQAKIQEITRRGKYLLVYTTQGSLIIHLGMSGCLLITPQKTPAGKHDHVDFVMDNQVLLRYSDPRKFGLILWTTKDPLKHALLSRLGAEPLSAEFNGHYFKQMAMKRKRIAIKNFIMDSKVVVGVGNIYASEALYDAGIHPARCVQRISLQRFETLVSSIKKILKKALKQGGTSLKDFVRADGRPGYFRVALKVYGRAGQPCGFCGNPIQRRVLGQRSSFYCGKCQR